MSKGGALALALLASSVCAVRAGEPEALRTVSVDIAAGPLLACLEHLAQRGGVRIVDGSGRVAAARCPALHGDFTLETALQRWLAPLSLSWRRRDDGTIEIVDATRPHMELSPLTIEDAASPKVARVLETGAVLAPTPLAEDATAVTRLDGDWIERAPWLGFGQLGRYAPNLYGTGQGLAIRGMERGTDDHFTTLTVSLDGIDLGTRLLDDDVVLLNGLQRIDLVRGARSFEAGGAAAAGAVRLISAAPAAEDEFDIGMGWGTAGMGRADVRWSGPLPVDGLGGTAMLAYRSVPAAVRFQNVPRANGLEQETTNARLRLDYSPDGVPGLQAGVSALAVSAGHTDRLVTSPYLELPDDVFDRINQSTWVRLAHTRAQGAAGFVRYEDEGTRYELYGSDTVTREEAAYLPRKDWADAVRENRSRAGFKLRKQWGETKAVAGFEHTGYLGRAESEYQLGNVSQFGRDRLRIDADSASLWLEHRWSPAWEAGLGLRWLRERFAEEMQTANPWSASAAQTMSLPLATLAWHPDDTHTVTASRTAGYISGGSVWSGSANDVNVYHHYLAMPTENVEVAWHAAWTPAVRTDVSVFRGTTTDRRDQVLVDGGVTRTRLIVTDVQGAEFETTLAFSPRWQLRAGLGLLDSRYRRDTSGLPEVMQATGDTPGAPPFTALLGLRYGARDGWFAALDAYRAGATVVYESAAVRRMPYSVVDGSLGYAAPGWQASLTATNATNARYAERYSQFGIGNMGWRLGDPRRLEMRLDFSW